MEPLESMDVQREKTVQALSMLIHRVFSIGPSKLVECHRTLILLAFKGSILLGKKVGVLTTTRITHATPSATYAHIADRDWEAFDNKNFGAQHTREGCVDIAHQLVLRSPPIDLLLGGGRKSFYPVDKIDVEYSTKRGVRTDNLSLIDELWRGRYL